MSTADDAWNDWLRNRPIAPSQREVADHFYRRALQDAADGIDRDPQIPLPPSIYSALCREWAEDVGTKDGDDEIEVPCLSCNDDPNVDCPTGCGRR